MRKYREYNRLNFDKRKQIEQLLKSGKSVFEISALVGTSTQCIYKEFRRTGLTKEDYSAEKAQLCANALS